MRLPQRFFFFTLISFALISCHKDAPPAPTSPTNPAPQTPVITHYDLVPDSLLSCVDSIIYLNGDSLPSPSDCADTIVLDLDSNGQQDARLIMNSWYAFHSNTFPLTNYQYSVSIDSLGGDVQFYGGTGGPPLIPLLNANDTVYANQQWKNSGYIAYDVNQIPFAQIFSGTKYIAFRFRTGNNLYNYGWLKMTCNRKYYIYIQDWAGSTGLHVPLRMGQL